MGATHFGAAVLPNAEARIVGDSVRREPDAEIPPIDNVDRLHSVASVKGYYVHALDGDIGHVENLLADDTNWEIHSRLRNVDDRGAASRRSFPAEALNLRRRPRSCREARPAICV